MNVDITSPSAPAPNHSSTVPSGLPVNRVPVVTQPPTTNTSLKSSIHAHPLPFLQTLPLMTKWIVHSPGIPPMVPAHAAIDQAITKRSLSSSMISMTLPIVSASHVQIFSI
ncbi:hypothetical protein RhiirC2_803677 [Rhizophagus irregularis]|uniref:Uncharacterized protein n=1 Tax=Rhizophagus irregularis TaxID=588596 RepID=A0A2N1LDG3_9GLOM|nr:hypothetical protein RhiirC2_803677 [Rhizophagus irregularis]